MKRKGQVRIMRKKFQVSIILLVTVFTTILCNSNIYADYYDDLYDYDNEYGYDNSDEDDLKLNYFEIAREMKDYAKNHPKEAKFKNIDVGTCCRLYGMQTVGSYDKKIESSGWASVTIYRNYIELTRKKGVTKIAYYVNGEVSFISIYDYTELTPDTLKLRTFNRRLNYSLDLIKAKKKYSKGVYTSTAKVKSELSSNENINYDKFSKYEIMLSQKKFNMNFAFDDDIFTSMNISKRTKNSWYKLTDFYENIIFE